MAGHLYTLIFITIGLVSSARTADTGSCNLETVQDSLETLVSKVEALTNVINGMKEAQVNAKADRDDIKQDQVDLKKHTLKRLQALDEKTELCLSYGQTGAQPLDERMTQLEEHINDQNTQLTQLENLVVNLKDPKDCQEVYNQGFNKSGVYTISPDGVTKMNVYCEQELDGGGWTVFQRRQDGSVDFYRNWTDYKTGFGNVNGEFWLGNDNVHLLTKDHDQKLKIELRNPDGEVAYADYSTFWIDDEYMKYKLHVSGFSGADPPGDSFEEYHNQMAFSTKDRDNDLYTSLNCAQSRHGAWWYRSCHHSNLNGPYGNTRLNWYKWKGVSVSLTGTKMMIKRKL